MGSVYEIAMIFGFLCSVIGCILNNRKLLLCWPLFILADIICAYIHFIQGSYIFAVRELMFLALCFEGYYRWKYKKNER